MQAAPVLSMPPAEWRAAEPRGCLQLFFAMLKQDAQVDTQLANQEAYSSTESSPSNLGDSDNAGAVRTRPTLVLDDADSIRLRSDSVATSSHDVHPLVGKASNGFYCIHTDSCCPPDEKGQGKWQPFITFLFCDRRCQSFAVSFLWCSVCVYWNSCMQVVAQNRAIAWNLRTGTVNNSAPPFDGFPAGLVHEALPDLLFEWIPEIAGDWPDKFLAVQCVLTLIRFLITPMRLTIIRRFFFILGCLFLLRGFTIVVTLLPNPMYGCRLKNLNEEDLAHPALAGFKVMTQTSVTCADVLYSGHTVNMTLFALCWHQYSHVVPITNCKFLPRRLRTFFRTVCCCGVSVKSERGHGHSPFQPAQRLTTTKLIVWILTVVGYYCIIATHFHYTVDVIVGFAFTIIMWSFYHQIVLSSLELGGTMNPLDRIVSWMEGGAEDVKALKVEMDKWVDHSELDPGQDESVAAARRMSSFMAMAHNPAAFRGRKSDSQKVSHV